MQNTTIIFIFTCNMGNMGILPVKPSQETLGGTNQLHHRGEEIIGWLAWGAAIICGTFPSVRRGHVQTVGGCSHPHNQSLQVVRLYTIVLKQRFNTQLIKKQTQQTWLVNYLETVESYSQRNMLLPVKWWGCNHFIDTYWMIYMQLSMLWNLPSGPQVGFRVCTEVVHMPPLDHYEAEQSLQCWPCSACCIMAFLPFISY